VSRGSVRGDVVGWASLMSDTIRVMTWNVHGTFNLNPHFDIDGVCAIIEKWAPDVVALQEVDSRGRTDDVFGRLADSVGEHRVEARSIIAEDGHYGQVLLSRWPFVAEPRITDVSYLEREPRRAISARVRFPIGEVTVIATHLGLSVRERTGSGTRKSDRCAPKHRNWRFQRLVLGQVCSPRTGIALSHSNAVANVPFAASSSEARPDLRHTGRENRGSMGRPQRKSVLGSFARSGGYRRSAAPKTNVTAQVSAA
jgi:hypothetical protein